MPAIPTPPKRSFRTPEAFRPAHWVSAKTPMRGEDIVGAQRALADVGHYRPWPDLGFQPVAERRLFEGLKAFQKSKGLAPDGVMGPAGPTAQALDAARHAKATAGAKRSARDLLGRGANLPLDLSVGEGGANREADVKAAKAALGLLGYYPPEKAQRPDGLVGRADDHDFEFGLGAFQRRFGLKTDRRMDPFGPTQARLDELLQPALDRAFGFDIENPTAPAAEGPAGQAGPLLISADPEARPQTQAAMLEQLRAHGLAHMAETRRTDALYGFDGGNGKDTLDGGAEEDRLGDAPETTGPDADVEDAARPEAAARGDAAKQIDDATDEADGVEAAAKELHHTLEQVAPDLSGRQIVQMLDLAEAHGVDAGDGETLGELADWVRENRPDFATTLRDQLDSGDLDVDELASRTARHARRLKSGAGSAPTVKARLADHVAVLQEQYEKQGLSETAAAEKVAAQLAEATRGGGALAELALVLLEFAPITGEIMSAVEAAKLARELWAAQESGDTVAAARIQGELSLAILGAIPFVGKFAKTGRLARKIKPSHRPRSQELDLELETARDHFHNPYPSSPARRFLSEETQRSLGREKLAKMEGIFSYIKGITNESGLKLSFDAKDLARISKEVEGDIFYLVPLKNGKIIRIKIDEITKGRLRKNAEKNILEIVDLEKYYINEFKLGSGTLTRNQRAAYSELQKGKAEIFPDPTKKNSSALPNVETEIEGYRLPVFSVDEEELIANVLKYMGSAGIESEIIDEFIQNIHLGYKLDRKMRAEGRKDAASSITLAVIFSATMGAFNDEIEHQATHAA